jgi:V8-like Glu-specific endopeptidase
MMAFDLKTCVVRVEILDGHIGGTGFVVTNNLVVTCAHVIKVLRV